jgi:methylthioribulose-1-phosphate dehydratase
MEVYKTPLEKILIREVTRIAKVCYERGWCFGTAGNFSVRVRNDLIWQSPSSKNKGQLKEENFIPIDISTGKKQEGMLYSLPSLEMPVHLCIYKMRPQARVILHCHPPHLVKFSQTHQEHSIKFGGAEMVKALGAREFSDLIECGVIPNLSSKEMENLTSLEGKIMAVPAIVLRGHGIYAWGHDVEEALGIIEAMEFILHTTYFNQ